MPPHVHQRTPKSDVQQLDPTTDGVDRHVIVEGGPQKAELHNITRLVEPLLAGRERLRVVTGRVDVLATGQHQGVGFRHELLDVNTVLREYDPRFSVGPLDSIDVFLGVVVQTVGSNGDDRFVWSVTHCPTAPRFRRRCVGSYVVSSDLPQNQWKLGARFSRKANRASLCASLPWDSRNILLSSARTLSMSCSR